LSLLLLLFATLYSVTLEEGCPLAQDTLVFSNRKVVTRCATSTLAHHQQLVTICPVISRFYP